MMNNKYKGYTLAEVLITIGIVGIISALTIPALIQKYQEKVTVNKVKAFYSTMNRALKMAIAENGDVDGWVYGNSSTQFWGYLSPYIKIIKDCGLEELVVLQMRVFHF